MKHFILLLFVALVAVTFSAENSMTNKKFKCYDLWDDAIVYLDSGEVDTATDVWNMYTYIPNADGTLGTLSALSTDSSGTDSVAYTLSVDAQFNEGSRTGYWTEIDKMEIDKASTLTLDTATITTALNPKFVRFRVTSDASKAGEKPKIYEIKFCPVPGTRVY